MMNGVDCRQLLFTINKGANSKFSAELKRLLHNSLYSLSYKQFAPAISHLHGVRQEIAV